MLEVCKLVKRYGSGPGSRVAIALFAASTLGGCQHRPVPGESIAEACRLENDKREARASGYLQAPVLIGCEKKDCALQLTATRKERYGMTVRLPLGTGPSTMTPLAPSPKAPGGIYAEPVTVDIRDAKGASARVGDVVRVTGRATVYDTSDGIRRCELDVTRLESL